MSNLTDLRVPSRERFDEFVRDTRDLVFRYVAGMLRDDGLAEDAAAEVFMRTFQGLEQFRNESSFGTWFFAVMRNTVRSFGRKNKVLGMISLGLEEDSDGPRFQEQDRHLGNFEKRDALKRAIAVLPGRQREVFVLRYLEDFSITETAKLLRISEGGVKSNLFKALENLRKELNHVV